MYSEYFTEARTKIDQNYSVLIAGNLEAAEKVRSAKTTLNAERIGATVRDPQDWVTEKLEVMEEIMSSKAEPSWSLLSPMLSLLRPPLTLTGVLALV